ncbi:MFS transporter [Cohnella sp. CFH 77786]|uniref:MFS transporter n=1 Tax=Cohnella sp. CFH 77786 TaxID=2662265 RepID=UPI001C610DCD|nr:MFS transporter [Cohnella sp. CFH 77786]MBW5446065.1 MFS transporter [Cohnella sp. CFH 77786]
MNILPNVLPNIGKLYAIRFFHSLIPAYVIERLYWEERGMTIPLVVYAEIIYAASNVLLEVPTGMIADRWGRKRMLMLAAAMGCLEFLILLYASEFWHFALVVFLAAIGSSAASGAGDALLYDSLRSAGREGAFEKILGRLNSVDISSTILAALCGSLLAGRYGLEFNYWISLGSMLICLAVTFTLAEPPSAYREEQAVDRPMPMRTYWTASLRFFRRNPGVRLVVLSGMVTGAAINFVDEFWQTYLNRVGVPVVYFGLVSAAIFLCRLPGNLLAYKLKEVFGYRTLLSVVTAGVAAGFLVLSLSRGFEGLAALAFVCTLGGMIEPLASGYLHHRADSSMRATIGSFQSLGENAVVSIVGIGFGYFSSKMDIFGGFGFIAVVAFAFWIGFSATSRKVVR